MPTPLSPEANLWLRSQSLLLRLAWRSLTGNVVRLMRVPSTILITLNSLWITWGPLLVLASPRRERVEVSLLDKVPLVVTECVDKSLEVEDLPELDLREVKTLFTGDFPSSSEGPLDLDTRRRSTILSSLMNWMMSLLDPPATVSLLGHPGRFSVRSLFCYS